MYTSVSGRPILQNGKLIGVVTYVFVNDPTRGMGFLWSPCWTRRSQLTTNRMVLTMIGMRFRSFPYLILKVHMIYFMYLEKMD